MKIARLLTALALVVAPLGAQSGVSGCNAPKGMGADTLLVCKVKLPTPSSVPVPPVVSSSWPNEPAGMTLVTDHGFDQAIPVQVDGILPGLAGWGVLNPSGTLARVADPAAPFSPPNVMQATYPIGFSGGPGVGTMYVRHPDAKELFVGVVWKVGAPYQYSNSGNQKIVYAMWNENANTILVTEMCGDHAPAEFCVIPVRWPVDQILHAGKQPGTTQTPVALNTWYRLEYYLRYASAPGASDAVVRWWASSWSGSGWNAPVLQGDFTNLQSPADSGGNLFELYTGWSGTLVKTEVDHVFYDHIHVSRR